MAEEKMVCLLLKYKKPSLSRFNFIQFPVILTLSTIFGVELNHYETQGWLCKNNE